MMSAETAIAKADIAIPEVKEINAPFLDLKYL
jgi:hypothetical protein